MDRDEELMAKPSKIPERKASKTSEDTKAKEGNKNVPAFQLDDDFEDESFLGQYLPQAESSRISSAMENKPHVAEEEKVDNKRISEELHNEDLTKGTVYTLHDCWEFEAKHAWLLCKDLFMTLFRNILLRSALNHFPHICLHNIKGTTLSIHIHKKH